MNKKPITAVGKEKLEAELKNLKEVKRPEISKAIAEAKENGDLKENAEYHSARDAQGFCEGKIADLESIIPFLEVINPKDFIGENTVKFGAEILLSDLENQTKKTYIIVGETESDITLGKIAFNSPVAKALIGKNIGDTVEVKTPSGIKEFEIISVNYDY